MKAVGYQHPHPLNHPEALCNIELPRPEPGEHDLLVHIRAVSVNPVDVKVRSSKTPPPETWQVLGWDAAGVVVATGSKCTLFKEGDEVYYAGSIIRQGTNSEYHIVDERIVGHKPTTIDFAQAASLPLTTITAWELLFDRLQVKEGPQEKDSALLITAGAGGVGSILIQLARALTNLTIIATASRPQSSEWCMDMGAHHVINHMEPMAEQIAALHCPEVSMIASLSGTQSNFSQLVGILTPQGKIALIDDPHNLDVMLLKSKSASLHWEFMFARSLYETPDMIAQHHLLNKAAALVDKGIIKPTITQHHGLINAANIKNAHALIESGRTIGKMVLEGF